MAVNISEKAQKLKFKGIGKTLKDSKQSITDYMSSSFDSNLKL